MGPSAFQTEPASYVSPEEYLRLERKAESKHGYYQGESRAMAGLATHTILLVLT